MPRYSERQSRFSNDEEPRSTSRRPSSSGRGTGRQQKTQQAKVNYCTIFALFANEHSGGRLQVDIRAFDGDESSIEDHLTLEEFLFFCEKLYYGETKLTGSMWECDEKFASHQGNIRFSEDQIDELKEEYKSVVGAKSKAKKTEPKASSRKPRYEVPEEDDEEEEYEEVEVKSKAKKHKPELDMPVEEVSTEEIPY